MSLASEDRSLLRVLAHEIRDEVQRSNELLAEIRDLLKSAPVTVSGRSFTTAPICTCGESKEPCPVHEPG
jgi:hypothetical protein